MKRHALPILLALLVGAVTACREPADTPPDAGEGAAPVLAAPAATTGPAGLGSVGVAGFWSDPAAPGEGLVLAAAGLSGVLLHTPDGRRAGALEDVEAGLLTVVPARESGTEPLVIVYDRAHAALRPYRVDPTVPTLVRVPGEPVTLDDELTGLCRHRSRLANADYLYAVTDGGLVLHYELYTAGDRVGGRLLRRIPVGKGATYCDVDPRDATLYVVEETVGIWRLGAEPESDTVREPLELVTPWGSLGEEVKGIAVYRAGETAYVVAADDDGSRLVVVDPEAGKVLGRATIEGLGEAEGLSAVTAFGDTFSAGALAIADEDAPEGSNLKLVDWGTLASALGLRAADAGQEAEAAAPAVVRPVLETEVAASFGDAADDPAIWVHPEDPAKSLVIGTDKQLGLYVFDLEGRTLFTAPDGRMNNVDLRDGFPLGGEEVTLVAASNRSHDTIAVYRLDAGAPRLVDVAAGPLATGFADPYGLCLYRSAESGDLFVFVNEGDEGTFRQWRLHDDGNGRVAAELVREFEVGSQAEGCVADDETGALFVTEEGVGLWKYSAEPDGGDERRAIDDVDGGRLEADVEGVALWLAPDGGGYIVVSSQGADNYLLYERGGEHAYVGSFHVVANAAAGVDGASETDGLDVTSAPLGDRFPQGLLVVQDGRNIAPEERQNFKYVSWADVAEALDL
jgi:3-phytase